MRSAYGGELGPLVLQQARLRARAGSKHPAGDRMWWTQEALEQASSAVVARWRAERYGAEAVLDLGCSVGGDLVALAARGPAQGVDLDEARLLLARANLVELGLPAAVARADALSLPLGGRHVFADPARRRSGRRALAPRSWSPPLPALLAAAQHARALGVKAAPGLDHDALPDDLEVEVVSVAGEVKEAVLWAGDARTGARRAAVLLPEGHRLVAGDVRPEVGPVRRFLLDADGAVVRAHVVAELAAQVGGTLLDPTIAYITADEPVPTAYGSWYEVLEHLPFALKPLRERLRAHDAGSLVVKKRGTAVEPEVLRAQLRLRGSRTVTVVLTRVAGRQTALVVRPVKREVDEASRPYPRERPHRERPR